MSNLKMNAGPSQILKAGLEIGAGLNVAVTNELVAARLDSEDEAEESFISRFGPLLLAFVRDNPNVIFYLQEGAP